MTIAQAATVIRRPGDSDIFNSPLERPDYVMAPLTVDHEEREGTKAAKTFLPRRPGRRLGHKVTKPKATFVPFVAKRLRALRG
jgi:hypothetical protein